MKNIREIKLKNLNNQAFIRKQVKEIAKTVGNGTAVNALSGGVDSSAVTMLAHKALGKRLKTYFIDHGLMREGEPERVVAFFKKRGVNVQLVKASSTFFKALKGKSDPEKKRQAITDTFYKTVFGPLVKKSKAKFLLQGTIYTDVEETIAGIKRQHNILAQLGIDTKKVYGYKVLEPVIELRKPAVRIIARALGLPKEIYNRPPFPGPALTTRVIGEATPARIALVKKATCIVEKELAGIPAFQCMAILHEDKVTGIRDGKRQFGNQIEVRCWDSKDAVTASPTEVPFSILKKIARRITSEMPSVVSVTYNIATKPTSTIEAV
ncbi:MAG: ATP-binding protein [Kiritimatiellae bacterium]|nr:ATP-binding protein [Kiritimatiellia bacterium]MDD5521785.1 ATP-binding protein [Kiritimatiellia bacterium]